MKQWVTVGDIDRSTRFISEYRHWKETHYYLPQGSERTLLIDTGQGNLALMKGIIG